MSKEYSEDMLIEESTREVLQELGWHIKYAWGEESFGKDGLLGRADKTEIILTKYLHKSLKKLNPNLPDTAYDDAISQISAKYANRSLIQINQDKYNLFKTGVQVTWTNTKNIKITKRLKIFDFQTPENNSFIAVRQLEITGELHNRRPDIVGFVNGIPLILFELKAHHKDLSNAYEDNLKDYKDTIPDLFNSNAMVILSNGVDAKVGTITSAYKFFHEWKRIREQDPGKVALDTILRGVCEPCRFMDLFENFILFDESSGNINKIIAKNHQFIGVNKVLEKIETIEDLEGRLGVFWHTQGSGKSYSMVFLCQKILRKLGGSYTFLIVSDRQELERQLYETFTGVGAVTEDKVKASSRDHLRTLLTQNHKYIFSLVHKFSVSKEEKEQGVEYPLISERKNIIVISDEAHRTQGGRYARNMRFNAIPNASFLGFTGTPIIKGDGDEDEVTKNIFGEYVSVYDFNRAIADNATVKLTYMNRGEKLKIKNPELDAQIAEILDNEDLDEAQELKLNAAFNRDYPILTSEPRLDAIAKDLVWHFNDRGYQGKGMFIAIDKPTAVRMFDLTMKHWAAYIADLKLHISQCSDVIERKKLEDKLELVEKTEVCVVVSSEQNELDKFKKLGLDIKRHRKNMVERDLDKEFKDKDNPFRLVIVCAMWITGFDAPCVSTMYLDKPLKQHTLMQTIARANRVYDDNKECGLIIDYGNVYKKLEEAYNTYGNGDGATDEGDAKRPLEKLQELADELKLSIERIVNYIQELGYNLNDLIQAEKMDKIAQLANAINAVSLNEKTRVTYEIMARDVFRKYKALFPEDEVKQFLKQYNAIDAIYNHLQSKVKTADITNIMSKLQGVINDSVMVAEKSDVYSEIDLTNMNIAQFADIVDSKKGAKTLTLDLMKAVEQKLNKMVAKNPERINFLERYKEIVDEYNRAKDIEDIKRVIDKTKSLIEDTNKEEMRAMEEGLDEDSLAIFDILRKDNLSKEDRNAVKQVASDTLSKLRDDLLSLSNWRASTQVKAQIEVSINDSLYYLPEAPYPEDEINNLTQKVYQHIFTIHLDNVA